MKKIMTLKMLLLSIGVLTLLFAAVGCNCKSPAVQSRASNESYSAQPAAQNRGYTNEPYTSFVGPAGSQGPTGPAGAQGAVGPSGAQGARGATGQQGASIVGTTGAVGAVGPAGPQGARGEAGRRGETLIGPTGPVGQRGIAGAQGEVGDTGYQGAAMAGAAGAAGAAGPAGEQGRIGDPGVRGPTGVVEGWTPYRTFWFDPYQTALRTSDEGQISEIATYMQQNQSLQIGVDDSIPNGSDQDLANRRINTVRSALINAGIPDSRIVIGAFGDPKLASEQRVEVLLATTYYTKQ